MDKKKSAFLAGVGPATYALGHRISGRQVLRCIGSFFKEVRRDGCSVSFRVFVFQSVCVSLFPLLLHMSSILTVG